MSANGRGLSPSRPALEWAGRLDGKLTIEWVAPGALQPDPTNPRRHEARQIRQIARSIKAFGFIVPLVVGRGSRVICGHGRLAAALRLGLAEVPVVRAEHLTAVQARAFQIADNKLTDNSDWDERLLGEALRDLTLEGVDLDIAVTGFEMGEIDLLIEGLDDTVEPEADPDDLPPPAGPPVTQVGDVWEVLGHRIVCSDALAEASYAAVMAGGERASMTFADPPYNVRIQGNAAGFGQVKYDEFAAASGEMSEREYYAFLAGAFERIVSVSVAGALLFCCCDWRHVLIVTAAARPLFAQMRNLAVWAKDHAGQGSFYRSQHELIPIFQVGGGRPRNNVMLGKYGRSRSNVWRYPSPSAFGRAGEEGRLTLDHPTPKPVQLVADAMLDCTARGDLVLDPFLGGGASLVAAERVGRRCRAIELEPKFVDASLRRLRRLTGEDARRLGDGRRFADLEEEAGGGRI